MRELIEFFEMVSMNDAALRADEKAAILKARVALEMFEAAMQGFRTASVETPAADESCFVNAA